MIYKATLYLIFSIFRLESLRLYTARRKKRKKAERGRGRGRERERERESGRKSKV